MNNEVLVINNGWLDTYFNMAESMFAIIRLDDRHPDKIKLYNKLCSSDSRELTWIAKDWTQEFEDYHKNTSWDGEFYEAIEEFIAEKLKQVEL